MSWANRTPTVFVERGLATGAAYANSVDPRTPVGPYLGSRAARVSFGVALLSAFMWFVASVANAQTSNSLEFVGASELIQVLTMDKVDKMATVKLRTILRNTSGESVTAQLRLVPLEGDIAVLPQALSSTVEADSAAWVVAKFRIPATNANSTLHGYLMATAPGVAPAILPVTLLPGLGVRTGKSSLNIVPAWSVVLASVILTLLVSAVAFAFLIRKHGLGTMILGDINLGAEKWDGARWVAGLTAIGATLSALLNASNVLPNDPAVFSRGDYFGLSLLFAVITAGAGAAFLIVGPIKKLYVLVLCVVAVMLGAYGTILTLAVYLGEIAIQHSLEGLTVASFSVLLAVAAVMAGVATYMVWDREATKATISAR